MKFILLLFIFANSNILGQNNFPASLMEMNDPEYLMKHSGPWDKHENESIILLSSTKIKNERLLQSILESQTENISHILSILNIQSSKKTPKVFVWIFNDDNEKFLKTQVKSNAHCLSEYHSVYYNKSNSKGAHELGHYLTQIYLGYLQSQRYDFLLDEGFAFLVDEGRFFKYDYYLLAKEYLSDTRYLVTNITDDSPGDYKKKAFVSASFLKYLIQEFGIESFKKLWKSIREDDKVFEQIYGKSFLELEKDFINFIKQYS